MKRSLAAKRLVIGLLCLFMALAGCHNGSGHDSSGAGGGDGGGGAGGGAAFTVNDDETGAVISVPANAYDPDSPQPNIQISKSADLPQGATPLAAEAVVGDVYTLTKDYADNFLQPIEITVPYDPAETPLPVVLYWDETRQQYESAPVTRIDSDAGTVTFSTVHFSSFVLAGHSGLNGATTSLFAVDTGFSPAADGFFVPNFGSFAAPGGSAPAMVDFALWYFKYTKATDTNGLLNSTPGLYNKYREGDTNSHQDDYTAKGLIAKAQNATSQIWENRWDADLFQLTQQQTGLLLLANMLLSDSPQKLILRAYDGDNELISAQPMLAYKYVPDQNNLLRGIFYLYDPNFPGEAVTITWDFATGFSGFSKSAAYADPFTGFVFDGLGSSASYSQFQQVFADAESAQAKGAIAITAPTLKNGVATEQLISTTLPDTTVSGTVTPPTGSPLPAYLQFTVNGGTPTVINLSGATFSFIIPGADLSASNAISLKTTDDLKDPWNFSAFASFTLNFTGQTVTSFINPGFETGDTTGWDVETHSWYETARDLTGSPFPTVSSSADPNVPAAYRNVTDAFGNYYSATGSPNPNYNTDWGKVTSFTTVDSVDPGKSAIVSSTEMAVLDLYWSADYTATTAGVDPIFDYYLANTDVNTTPLSTLSLVFDGANALRVNNADDSYHVSSATQTATIPSLANPTLKFSWAALLEDPGHDLANQPYVDVSVYDATAETFLYHEVFVSGIPSYSGWVRLNNSKGETVSPTWTDWNVIPWQQVTVNAGAAIGHEVTIRVTASDCGYGGHGGYAYLDDSP